MDQIDRKQLSPMMQHYMSIKDQHPDCLVMYRLGDFYEMFFDDAKTGARVLELTLTGRDCGIEGVRAAMCGVPHHVVEPYITKLVDNGYKVAIVDQMEDPKQAKGLVKRAVTRIISPGTLTDMDGLQRDKNNFLLSVISVADRVGIAYTDISTGAIFASSIDQVDASGRSLYDLLSSIQPSEILAVGEVSMHPVLLVLEQDGTAITHVELENLNIKDAQETIVQYLDKKAFRVVQKENLAAIALQHLLLYVHTFQKEKFSHFNQLKWVDHQKALQIDASTRENLEIHANLNDHSKRNSLLGTLDRCKTAMGSRLLDRWLEYPLLDQIELERRLDSVEAFYTSTTLRLTVAEYLDLIYDLERLLGKLAFNRGNARDLLSLKSSLEPLPVLRKTLVDSQVPVLVEIANQLDTLLDVYQPIADAILEDAPIAITEGGMIKEGYSEKLDQIRYDSIHGKEQLIAYEQEEKERTGIKNLRIIYNRVTGYAIEVTKSFLDRVPDDYRRRQTLKNAERFTSDALEKISSRILGSEEEIVEEEYQIFQALRSKVEAEAIRLQETANTIAMLDVLRSFAEVAVENRYVRPSFSESDEIDIKDGRHPVVERSQRDGFIPNDTKLGEADNRIQIITGPNMAGKSTYMRQVALILIMAQTGSFVPASFCEIPISDRIFTRIGASDNLARGDSTFMVEMKEMANIIENATKKSFLVLDEVGRGTSTNDGLAIAYAILEYLSRKLPAKTLFATHYHELTSLADRRKNISNRKVEIHESDGKLIFLRKVVEGKADKSYGIEVARLSGLPEEIIERSKYILQNIENINDVSFVDKTQEVVERQKDFADFRKDMLIEELSKVEVNQLSPLEALNILSQYVDKAGELS